MRSAPWGSTVRNSGIGAWPERRLRISPGRDAIWFEGVTSSYGDLALRVRRTAAALAALGIGRGDRVAWTGSNHPSALETLYACGQLGAVWVPFNARLTVPEAEYVLTHSGASVVVYVACSGRRVRLRGAAGGFARRPRQ